MLARSNLACCAPASHTSPMKCLDCGFLAYGDGEVMRKNRLILAQGIILAEVSEARLPIQEHLKCLKSLWAPEAKGVEGIWQEINKERLL